MWRQRKFTVIAFIINIIIQLALHGNLVPSSMAQPQRQRQLQQQQKHNPFLSEFQADYKNQHNNDKLKYNYHYYIDHTQSMVHLHHQEERHGTRTKGEYALLQPDGTVRHVYYMVDGEGGFRAVVRTRTAASSTHQQLKLRQQQPIKPIQHAKPVALIVR